MEKVEDSEIGGVWFWYGFDMLCVWLGLVLVKMAWFDMVLVWFLYGLDMVVLWSWYGLGMVVIWFWHSDWYGNGCDNW